MRNNRYGLQSTWGRFFLGGMLVILFSQAACSHAEPNNALADLRDDPEFRAKVKEVVAELREIRDGTTDKSLEEQKRLIAGIMDRVDRVVDIDNQALKHKLQGVQKPEAIQAIADKILAKLPQAEKAIAKGAKGNPVRSSEPPTKSADSRYLGKVWLPDGIDGLVVKDNIAYAAAMRQGLVLMDVADATAPRKLATVELGLANDVAVEGQYAYVAGGGRRMADGYFVVVDVSDPNKPREVARRTLPRGAPRVGLVSHYALLGCFSGGLVIFDIAQPDNPVEVGRFRAPYNPAEYPAAAKATTLENHAWGVKGQGNYIYLCDDVAGLRILDFSNPAKPKQLGRYMYGNGLQGFCNDVVVDGNYAYLAYDFAYLVILDISNKEKPREVGRLNPNGKDNWDDSRRIAIRLLKKGNHLLISQSRDGAVVAVDVSNPAKPREVRTYRTRASTWGLAVENDKVYAGSLAIEGHEWGGLEIFDAQAPAAKK